MCFLLSKLKRQNRETYVHCKVKGMSFLRPNGGQRTFHDIKIIFPPFDESTSLTAYTVHLVIGVAQFGKPGKTSKRGGNRAFDLASASSIQVPEIVVDSIADPTSANAVGKAQI